MFKNVLLFLVSLLLVSCSSKKEEVDLIIHNAVIYTVDSSFSIQQAMAVKDGKIIETGSNEQILNKYFAKENKDVDGKAVFPGFIDAHCHFLGYGLGLQKIDLTGTKSFSEVLERVTNFTVKKDEAQKTEVNSSDNWIIGRGWDQNDWELKDPPAGEAGYPDNSKLDSLFPNTPVFLKRVDGHAALVNSEALKRAGINEKTKISGGELILKNGKLSGVLIDNAVDLVSSKLPVASTGKMKQALLAAQKNCFEVGLTTVDDAGIMKSDVDVMDALQKSGELKMRIYAMLSDSGPNYKYYLEKGPFKTDRLNVRSFKFYADGALGSRGACLLENYSDKKDWKGFLLNTQEHFQKYAELMYENGFQMNTHCIGDSATRLMLYIYCTAPNVVYDTDNKILKEVMDKLRWRIEHAQVVNKKDMELFKYTVPSVQPTHATSDMYWAKDRLGGERIKTAYAYKDLLKANGTIALGTDFPVEDISPFKTFYAAVARKDSKGFPPNGFQMENALTRLETIKGMTIWPAWSNFEEKEKGSLEKGKFADFIILDKDIMKCNIDDVLKTKVLCTFINGEKVYAQ